MFRSYERIWSESFVETGKDFAVYEVCKIKIVLSAFCSIYIDSWFWDNWTSWAGKLLVWSKHSKDKHRMQLNTEILNKNVWNF